MINKSFKKRGHHLPTILVGIAWIMFFAALGLYTGYDQDNENNVLLESSNTNDNGNAITGAVIGMEGVTGFAANAAASFKKGHPTAKKTDYSTPIGEIIFTEKGEYILQTGDEYKGDAVKIEKIGGVDYPVTYSFKDKKPTPDRIRLFSEDGTYAIIISTNENVLRQLKSTVGKEDILYVDSTAQSTTGIIVHIKTSTKDQGGEESDSYRKTYITTESSYNKDGLTSIMQEERVTDNEGRITALNEITRRFIYNDKTKKDVPNIITEKKYEPNPDGYINEDTSPYTQISTKAANGEPFALSLRDKEGSVLIARAGSDGKVTGDEKAKSQLETLKTQFKSRQFFAQMESILTDFSGLGYYATLFFDDEDLDEWRETIDETFATAYLGTEYWESAICSTHIDRDQRGVAYIDTRLGLAAVAAHIEATRSQQITLPAGVEPGDANLIGNLTEENAVTTQPQREFLYKITFNAKNGDYGEDPRALEKMRFNVFLKGERTAQLFEQDIVLKKGKQFGAAGRDSIVQFSSFLYNKICIEFEDVPYSWSLDNDELCNTIVGAPSEPLTLEQREAAEEEQTVGNNIADI